MSNKPLNLLEVLDSPIKHSAITKRELECYGKIRSIEIREGQLDTDKPMDFNDLSDEVKQEVTELFKEIKECERLNSVFSRQYKTSLNNLVSANNGLPVHINAWDIHDHNLDVDNIVDTYKGVLRNDEDIPLIDDNERSLLDFFTDTSVPVFATAPYSISVVQLQSADTYGKTMGEVIDEDILKQMRIKEVAKKYGIETDGDYEKFQEMYLDMKAMEQQDTNIETLAIVQQYHINDYIEYLHMGRLNDNELSWGAQIKDTVFGQSQEFIDFGVSQDENDTQSIKQIVSEGNSDGMFEFITFVDFINKSEDEILYESTMITWLDKHGSPNVTRVYDPITQKADEDIEVSHSDSFNLLALQKVFQWWNSDNDLLEVDDLPITPSVRKRLKKYNRKQTVKKSITYKTLKVRPSIKVVDSDGVERTPRLREIAQHTRRGHWAHYGTNGKGLLFGKYAKSVYRKPKTIGKLANGLVLKDYQLLNEGEVE